MAAGLPVDYLVKKLIHTTAGRCTTIDWALKNQKTAVAVECGQHNHLSTQEKASEVIRSVVSGTGARQPPITLESTENVIVKKGFRFVREFKAFSYVHHNEQVARDDTGEIRCPFPSGAYIIMPAAIPVIGEGAWFWGLKT